MIRVPLTAMVFLYVAVGAAAVLVAWLLYERRRRRGLRRALQFRVRCAICGIEFEERSNAPLPLCPRCGHPNERLQLDPL